MLGAIKNEMVDLVQRIVWEKEKGVKGNYERVFSDLQKLALSQVQEFTFSDQLIQWIFFDPSEHYQDIIKESDETLYLYLRNKDLSFEVVACCYSYDLNKDIDEREIVISYFWVLGQQFPGLANYESRPVVIRSNNPFPKTPLKKLNYHLRTTLEKYQRLTKPIFEITDYHKDWKGWRIISKKEKPAPNKT